MCNIFTCLLAPFPSHLVTFHPAHCPQLHFHLKGDHTHSLKESSLTCWVKNIQIAHFAMNNKLAWQIYIQRSTLFNFPLTYQKIQGIFSLFLC